LKNKRMENSVKSLVNLYTVVIGVALSLAVVQLINVNVGLKAITIPLLLLFAAFVATLFPFYHGALRHLDDAYIENDNNNIKDGALVIDFILLFIHGLAFVVLSLLLAKPSEFAWVLLGLLSIDVIWGLFTHFAATTMRTLTAELKWSIINFAFVGFWIWYLVANNFYFGEVQKPILLAIPIVLTCVLRSIADYLWCREFYFPK